MEFAITYKTNSRKKLEPKNNGGANVPSIDPNTELPSQENLFVHQQKCIPLSSSRH